jgi:hypothetical protein
MGKYLLSSSKQASTADNVAAITPNCHRKIHHGQGGGDIDKHLAAVIAQKEHAAAMCAERAS